MSEDTFQFRRSQFFNKRRIVDNPLSVRGHRGKTRDGHEFQSQAQRSEKRLTQQELNTCARCALTEYIDHFHRERNHQGKRNKLLFPAPRGPVQRCRRGTVQYKERLGGLLRYYEARAA